MKSSVKFSLIGGLIGAIVMFIAVVIFEVQWDKHPPLDTQVIEHLKSEGFPVDTLGNDAYAFLVDEDKYIFDYFPEDPSYLRIFAGFTAEEYSRAEVEAACVKVMQCKKNCIMIPEETRDGMVVRICCESFVDSDDALDTKIIDRTIRIIQLAELKFFYELQGPWEDEE